MPVFKKAVLQLLELCSACQRFNRCWGELGSYHCSPPLPLTQLHVKKSSHLKMDQKLEVETELQASKQVFANQRATPQQASINLYIRQRISPCAAICWNDLDVGKALLRSCARATSTERRLQTCNMLSVSQLLRLLTLPVWPQRLRRRSARS